MFESNLRKITTIVKFEILLAYNIFNTVSISNGIINYYIVNDLNIIHRVNNRTWSNKELNSA